MSWFEQFPAMDAERLSAMRRAIDTAFRDFTRQHGQTLENFFEPLRDFLIFSERLLTQSPWPLVLAGIAIIAWLASEEGGYATGADFSVNGGLHMG